MEAPIVKYGGSNYQRWRLQIWRLKIINNLATNPPFFSSLLDSLILATSLLFFAINRDVVQRGIPSIPHILHISKWKRERE